MRTERARSVNEECASTVPDADFIRHILGRIGAAWDGENVLRVPGDFGLTPT